MTSDRASRRGSRLPAALAAAAIVLLAGGCGGDGYATSVVTGTVTYKGKPAAGLRIEFAPVDGPKLGRPPATGITGADGRYSLVRPGNKPGAVAGPSSVAFFTIEGRPTSVPAEAVQDRTFDVDVAPGTSTHDFDLGSATGSR